VAKHAAKCPKCDHPFEVDTAAGGSVTCPKCQATLNIAGRGRRARPVDPLIGASLGEFEVLELLGRGGMGAVYKGRQAALERFVAVKTLPRSLAANADFVARFYREARTAAALRHTHLVQVYAVGEAEGTARWRPRSPSTISSRPAPASPPRTRRGSSTATSSRRT